MAFIGMYPSCFMSCYYYSWHSAHNDHSSNPVFSLLWRLFLLPSLFTLSSVLFSSSLLYSLYNSSKLCFLLMCLRYIWCFRAQVQSATPFSRKQKPLLVITGSHQLHCRVQCALPFCRSTATVLLLFTEPNELFQQIRRLIKHVRTSEFVTID